jgi:hypothetical protein
MENTQDDLYHLPIMLIADSTVLFKEIFDLYPTNQKLS